MLILGYWAKTETKRGRILAKSCHQSKAAMRIRKCSCFFLPLGSVRFGSVRLFAFCVCLYLMFYVCMLISQPNSNSYSIPINMPIPIPIAIPLPIPFPIIRVSLSPASISHYCALSELPAVASLPVALLPPSFPTKQRHCCVACFRCCDCCRHCW